MMSFSTSSHFRNWIKTEEELKKMDKTKVGGLLKRIDEINREIKEENDKMSNQVTNHNPNLNNNNISNISKEETYKNFITKKKLISLEDEKFIIINYGIQLLNVLNLNQKSTSMKNNSLTYFRRFYQKKSIFDYELEYIMAASVFLGGKVAQLNISFELLEKLFPFVKGTEKKLIEYEFYLSHVLDYEFYVYSPYQALLGFIFSLKQKEFFLAQSSENYVNPNDFQQECVDVIDKIFLTNNIFLFTYSEIALASIFIKCEEKNINTINIAEKLELDKVINVKEFLGGPLVKIKQNLELIPKSENAEEDNNKAKELYKKVIHFHKSFPQYQKKLEEQRNILRNKMKSFVDDFEAKEQPLLKHVKTPVNAVKISTSQAVVIKVPTPTSSINKIKNAMVAFMVLSFRGLSFNLGTMTALGCNNFVNSVLNFRPKIIILEILKPPPVDPPEAPVNINKTNINFANSGHAL